MEMCWRLELGKVIRDSHNRTGANLSHLVKYKKQIRRLIGIEPNLSMRPHLLKESEKVGMKIDLEPSSSSIKDGTQDFVISTLVLCSVGRNEQEMHQGIAEVKRVNENLFL